MKKLVAWLVILPHLAACSSQSLRQLRVEEDLRRGGSPLIAQALKSEDARFRARAALAIGRIQDPNDIPLLSAQLQVEKDGVVQRALLFALGQMAFGEADGSALRTATEILAPYLEDSDPSTRAAAVEAMGKTGGAGDLLPLAKKLGDSLAVVRGEAAIALFRVRWMPVWKGRRKEPLPLPEPIMNRLTDTAGDQSASVRWRIAYALRGQTVPAAVTVLRTLASDPDMRTRLFAVRALGRSKSRAAHAAVQVAMRDASPLVRVEAVMAAKQLKAWDLYSPELTADPSWHVRASLARALSAKDAGGMDLLRKLRKDRSTSVRCAALLSLTKRGGDSNLAKALQEADWKIRVAAARAIAFRQADRTALAARALADNDHRVRAEAIGALGSAKDKKSGRFILKALSDPDLLVRYHAVLALRERADLPRLDALKKCYKESKDRSDVEVREEIAKAVAKDSKATEFLGVLAIDPAPSVRAIARKALRERGARAPEVARKERKPIALLNILYHEPPLLILETERGRIEIEFSRTEAPVHTASFVARVRRAFYDGLIFHRVVSNFVIQGGDPRGDGMGDGGYTLRDEVNRVPYDRGTVGMPKAGKDTGGCQFFITLVPTPHLDGRYTVFGRVVAGLDVVDKIEEGDRILRVTLRR